MITLFVHQSMNMLVYILLVLKLKTYSHICSKLIKLNSYTDTFIFTVHSYDKKDLEIM